MRLLHSGFAIAVAAGLAQGFAQTLPDAPAPVPAAIPASLAQLAAPPRQSHSGGQPARKPLEVSRGATAAAMVTMFPHSLTSRYWISGQVNVISQGKPGFHAAYSGPNSLDNAPEDATSVLDTLFLGYQAERNPRFNTDLLLDVEEAGGGGIGQALGLAGFTNLDVVRNPSLSQKPYLARAEIHQTFGLSGKLMPADRGPISLATETPVRRIEIRAGKFSLPDIFDVNSVASDSYHQFMNWTVDNNGAWDYAADTRGYTVGGAIEYDDHNWAVRYGFFAMPTAANEETLDWAFSRARGQNWELDWNGSLLRGRRGAIRLLAYRNNAHMGNYRMAVQRYLAGITPVPEIGPTERFDTPKYGFGWNSEQEITRNLRMAARFGWNDDREESYCFTEVGQTAMVAGDYAGVRWRRPSDKAGVAFVSNAIKKDHQNYLKYGGLGFLLGDGGLDYGREDIVESYYSWHVRRGFFLSLDDQHILHPGYNRVRGPVSVFSVRGHLDF